MENNVKAVSVYEAARENDMVVISILQLKVLELPKDLFEGVSEHVIIIDTGNYYPLLRNEFHKDLEGDLTNSEWVSKTIGRPVIKVFNSIGAMSLLEKGRVEYDLERIALAVSGDNAAQKQVVRDLLN
jgi:predicted dinucleotide-binding enzyme